VKNPGVGSQKIVTVCSVGIWQYYFLHCRHRTCMQESGQSVYFDPIECDVTETWAALEECVTAGLCKAIGVSNFSIAQISRILSAATIKPVGVPPPSLFSADVPCVISVVTGGARVGAAPIVDTEGNGQVLSRQRHPRHRILIFGTWLAQG
jgi:hypothetical protein